MSPNLLHKYGDGIFFPLDTPLHFPCFWQNFIAAFEFGGRFLILFIFNFTAIFNTVTKTRTAF